MFDVIICASAFVMIEDQSGAVKSLVKLLKKGGKKIFESRLGIVCSSGWRLRGLQSHWGF